MSITLLYTPTVVESESYDFNLFRNEIITIAYGHVGVKGISQPLTSEQFQTGSDLLNMMVKNWAADDIYLWNQKRENLALHASDLVLEGGVTYECIQNHKSEIRNKPGSGEEFKAFWKISTSTTATVWVKDIDFVFIGQYFLSNNAISIEQARVRRDNGTNILRPMSQLNYYTLGNAEISGVTSRFYFRKQITPEIFLYPAPTNTTDFVIELDIYEYPQDMDNGGDNPDFLQEWLEPLAFGLSVRLCPQQGIFGSQLNDLKKLTSEAITIAKKNNHEFGSLFMKPEIRGNNRGRS